MVDEHALIIKCRSPGQAQTDVTTYTLVPLGVSAGQSTQLNGPELSSERLQAGQATRQEPQPPGLVTSTTR